MQTLRFLAAAAALTFGVAQATLIGHYTFDETSGTIAADSGSAGAPGTIGTNVTLGTAGKFGTAFTFANDPSTSGIVDMGNATSVFGAINTSQAVTVSVWLNWTSPGTRDSAIFLGSDAETTRYLDIGTTSTGGVYGRVRNATSFPDLVRGSGLNNGQWHHVAYTANAATGVTQLYIDGVLAGTTTTPAFTFPPFNNFEIGRLGRSSPTDAYAGSVDELRIYDTVLSASDIADLAKGPVGDPSLQVDSTISFVNNGAPEILLIPISNEGASQTLILTEPAPITISGPDAASFTVSSYHNHLLPGSSGTLDIYFQPTRAGSHTATLTIASNDSLQPSREVAISVEVTDPIAVVAPSAIDFGHFDEVAGPQTRTLTITNDGGGTNLTVHDMTVAGSPAFSVNVPLPFAVAPGGSTEIAVIFDPAGADGNFAANLQILCDGYNQTSFTIPLAAEVKLSDPDASLVSHFTFDDETQLGDDTGSFDNDGTPVGDAQWTASARIGSGALLLDGSGDLIDLGTGSGPDYTSQLVADDDGFTVACWALVPTGTTVDRTRFFSAYARGASSLSEGWGVGQRNASLTLVGTTYSKADYFSPANSAPAFGAWHHYAYVFRHVPVNRIDFYIDGVLVHSQTSAVTGLTPATTVGFAIGALGRSTAFEGFAGRLDDLRIYSRELTGSNIADLFHAAPQESSYEIWATSHGLNPAGNGGYLEDPDGDGIVNSIEFLVGSSPVSGVPANLPVAAKGEDRLTVVYPRQTAAVAAGFVDGVEYSDVLEEGSWTTALDGEGGVTITIEAIDTETEEVTVSIPTAGPRMFVRLTVAAP